MQYLTLFRFPLRLCGKQHVPVLLREVYKLFIGIFMHFYLQRSSFFICNKSSRSSSEYGVRLQNNYLKCYPNIFLNFCCSFGDMAYRSPRYHVRWTKVCNWVCTASQHYLEQSRLPLCPDSDSLLHLFLILLVLFLLLLELFYVLGKDR